MNNFNSRRTRSSRCRNAVEWRTRQPSHGRVPRPSVKKRHHP